MFKLHPTLASDTHEIGQFPLSTALLMNNKLVPWVILVPRRIGIREQYELNKRDQLQLLEESSFVSESLMQSFKGDKLNVAAIGNIVPQLHLHHIVRYQYDPVWPNPVWGNLEPKNYTQLETKKILKRLCSLLGEYQGFSALGDN